MELVDIMTPGPATIEPTATVEQALALLQGLDVRHLPVVEGGVLVGMLSDRDLQGLAMATTGGSKEQLAAGRYLDRPVGEIMSNNLVTVSMSEDLTEVIDMMLEYKVGAMPVVDPAGTLVGIVSYIDLLRAWRDEL